MCDGELGSEEEGDGEGVEVVVGPSWVQVRCEQAQRVRGPSIEKGEKEGHWRVGVQVDHGGDGVSCWDQEQLLALAR